MPSIQPLVGFLNFWVTRVRAIGPDREVDVRLIGWLIRLTLVGFGLFWPLLFGLIEVLKKTQP